MKTVVGTSSWALMWQAEAGTRHLIHDDTVPALFPTRQKARAYAEQCFRYLRKRNLRCSARAVKVSVTAIVEV
jgi:hemolysin-activating ACP:hemolysin acyltransferase